MHKVKKIQSEKISGVPLIYQGLDLASENDSIFKNIRDYFLRRAPKKTLIVFKNQGERDEFTQRILQRLNIAVKDYSVLNIHKIGLNVPGRYVFEELLKWNGSSLFWPNRIAKVERMADQIEHIQIFLFGLKKIVRRYEKRWPLLMEKNNGFIQKLSIGSGRQSIIVCRQTY